MTLAITIILFIYGLVIGSFLNVVICRYNTQRNFGGRSACMSCNKNLCWYELIPLGSFIVQGGKCRGCKSKISIQYPLVEMIIGFLFAVIFLKYQDLFWANTFNFSILLAYYATIFSLLIVISVYDIRHKIIPDLMSLIFGIIAFVGIFIFSDGMLNIHIPTLYAFLSGPLLALPFAFLWFVSRGTWMGFGDAKLSLGLGWMLGISQGFSAVVMSFWIGGFISVGLLIFSKKYKIKSELPFAPFLVVGTILVFLFNLNFFNFVF
jgi:prepilin signal peptidase PulO-like enzyme (type II secretory pathway)